MPVSDSNDLEQRLARRAERVKAAKDEASVGDIVDYVKAYAQQETLGPLKGVGAWLGYGAAAALSLSIGLVLLLVGLLRLLQTEWDAFGERCAVVDRLPHHVPRGRRDHRPGDLEDEEGDAEQGTEVRS